MAFSILAVRSQDDQTTDLYPAPGEEPNGILLEAGERRFAEIPISGICAMCWTPGSPREIATFDRISASLFITGNRLAVACSKYDKGSTYLGWGLGGFAVAATATLISKISAAQRRRSRMLLGHVRYEWLKLVEANGTLGGNIVAVLFDPTDHNAPELVLRLHLNRDTNAVSVAKQIISIAAAHQADTHPHPAARRALREFGQSPTGQHISSNTVRFALPAAMERGRPQ